VSVAALVFVDPHVFVKTARYWLPLCETDGCVTVSDAFVAPVTLPQVEPESVLSCHWTPVLPLAAAVKVAFEPYVTVWVVGCVVIVGAVHDVIV
jgi:hypothetical protein